MRIKVVEGNEILSDEESSGEVKLAGCCFGDFQRLSVLNLNVLAVICACDEPDSDGI